MIGKNDLKALWKEPNAVKDLMLTGFCIASPGFVWIIFSGLGLAAESLTHPFLQWPLGFFYLASLILEIAAAGYFYREAELLFEGDEKRLPSWEDPSAYFRLGAVPVVLSAGVFSPAIFLFFLSLLMFHFQNLFWATFWVTFAFIFAIGACAVLPVVIFRMIEGKEYRWAFSPNEIFHDIASMKFEYAEAFISFAILLLLGQMGIFSAGAIICLTPAGIYLGGAATLLASAFFFSSIFSVLLRHIGANFLSLPS